MSIRLETRGRSRPPIRRSSDSPARFDWASARDHGEDRREPPTDFLSVLYVAEAFGGGLFEITRMLAEELARRGHRTAIAYGVRPETPPEPRAMVDPAVDVIKLPWTSRTATAQARALLALSRLCRGWRPDVVHLVSSFAGLHGAFGVRGVPVVYTPQGYSFTRTSDSVGMRWVYLILESWVARRVDLLGACSLSEGEQARSLPGARAIAVVPNGIPELSEETQFSTAPRATPIVSAIGRISAQRQPEACARILSGVADRAAVRWIGAGVDRCGERALRGAGVSVTGWMNRRAAMRALSECTVYLHWTAWDGLPLSILEAMAHDVIVVASDIGPNREVLGPEQVCRSEADAVDLIGAVLGDSELRGRLLANQRTRRRWYGADRMAAQWIELYRSLATAHRPHTRFAQRGLIGARH